MLDDFDRILQLVRECNPDQKQRIFGEIRELIVVHELERKFNVRAETILEAVARASDLVQRGVRGVIAETVFALEVVPMLRGWRDNTLKGDYPYDVQVTNGAQQVRIQVKLQRRMQGQPKMMSRDGTRGQPKDHFVVEVQRTRRGLRDGENTRPYRFGEFDLLAVCMEPSKGDWHAFMYAPAAALVPDLRNPRIIRTLQPVPSSDTDIWTSDLMIGLARATS
jgi:hypothetical protein